MINIKKRSGMLEPLNIEKIHDSLEWATEGIKGVSVSQIAFSAKLHFYEGMPTTEIHRIMIKTAKDMISLRTANYSQVAANLLVQEVYKTVFNSTTPSHLRHAIRANIIAGHYTPELESAFTYDDIEELEKEIEHNRDFNFSHAGLEQLIDKYIIKDKENKMVESPQHMFMAIAMDAFRDYSEDRLSHIKYMYYLLSTFRISLPTPEMKSLRTIRTNYASCVALNIGDSIDSWTSGKEAIMKHTVAGAGIGVDISEVSSINDNVKNGLIKHSGKIRLMRAIDADIQTTTQEGRRGQAVTYVNFFDPEIENILALKSPRTETAQRINDLKHCIKMNKVVYDRAKKGEMISLFSTRKHPELLKLFNSDKVEEFQALYEKLEEEEKYSEQIDSREFFNLFTAERFENGIYYLINIDEANSNCSYTEPITQSNICVEFLSPTKPITKDSTEPDIGICILSNINQGLVGLEELEGVTNLLVRFLNNIIHRQEHPTQAANAFVEQYASLGIGFSNHAYFLAKNGVKYGSEEGLLLHDEWMEHFQYYLLKASNKIAKNTKKVHLFNKTTYASGIMPIDRYNKNVDELVQRTLTLDWEMLKNDIVTYGLANAALSMVPPSETSSVIGNQTSGMEPIKDLLTIKGSKTNIMYQLAPEAIALADKYDFAFDRKITKDYLKHVAVTQKWIDQSISANTFYNPELYDDEKVDQKELIEDIFYAKHYGLKTLYYNNTKTPDNTIAEEVCSSGGCSV